MTPTETLSVLKGKGVLLEPHGDRLRYRAPIGTLTPELVREIRDNKEDILILLSKEKQQPQYCQLFQGKGPLQDELNEIERRVRSEGYVLLWSTVLEDLVAFHQDDIDPCSIPAGFVPYSERELSEFFPAEVSDQSRTSLRLIHEAKKMGGRIISSSSDETGKDG